MGGAEELGWWGRGGFVVDSFRWNPPTEWIHIPTKREVWKLIDSKMPFFGGLVPWRVDRFKCMVPEKRTNVPEKFPTMDFQGTFLISFLGSRWKDDFLELYILSFGTAFIEVGFLNS